MRPEGASWRPDAAGELAVARAGVALPESAVAALRSTFWRNNVLEAAPELDVTLHVGAHEVEATGTWFESELATPGGPWRTGLARLHPRWQVEGAWPAAGGAQLVLGRGLAHELGARVGDTLELASGARRARMAVAALVDPGGLDEHRMWLPLERAGELAQRPGELDRVALSALVKPQPRHSPARRQSAIRRPSSASCAPPIPPTWPTTLAGVPGSRWCHSPSWWPARPASCGAEPARCSCSRSLRSPRPGSASSPPPPASVVRRAAPVRPPMRALGAIRRRRWRSCCATRIAARFAPCGRCAGMAAGHATGRDPRRRVRGARQRAAAAARGTGRRGRSRRGRHGGPDAAGASFDPVGVARG